MDCQACQQLLLEYAYGELPPQLEEEFTTALEECPSCQEELARLQALRTSVREVLPLEEPPALVRANILREARKQLYAEEEAAQNTLWAQLHSVLFHPSFAMVAAVLLVVVVTLVLQRDGALEDTPIPESASKNLEAPPSEASAPAAPELPQTEDNVGNAGLSNTDNVGYPAGIEREQDGESAPQQWT
ncbi:MAG: zf-HC2 domain-containing protein, partial [Myxococcota bacterium]